MLVARTMQLNMSSSMKHVQFLKSRHDGLFAGADLGGVHGVHGVHVHPPSATCKVASHIAVNIQL